MRVVFVLRSAEIFPAFLRFVLLNFASNRAWFPSHGVLILFIF